MLITTKTTYRKNDSRIGSFVVWQKGDVENIEVVKYDYCCEHMRNAIDESFIHFGEVDACGINKDNNLNIINCHPYPEGASFNTLPIKFCPFCRSKIEIEEQC